MKSVFFSFCFLSQFCLQIWPITIRVHEHISLVSYNCQNLFNFLWASIYPAAQFPQMVKRTQMPQDFHNRSDPFPTISRNGPIFFISRTRWNRTVIATSFFTESNWIAPSVIPLLPLFLSSFGWYLGRLRVCLHVFKCTCVCAPI